MSANGIISGAALGVILNATYKGIGVLAKGAEGRFPNHKSLAYYAAEGILSAMVGIFVFCGDQIPGVKKVLSYLPNIDGKVKIAGNDHKSEITQKGYKAVNLDSGYTAIIVTEDQVVKVGGEEAFKAGDLH